MHHAENLLHPFLSLDYHISLFTRALSNIITHISQHASEAGICGTEQRERDVIISALRERDSESVDRANKHPRRREAAYRASQCFREIWQRRNSQCREFARE